MDTPGKKIVAKFGGIGSLARALGLQRSTVQYWKASGRIPTWRIPAVLNAAEERDIDLSLSDFFPKTKGKIT
jgi:hypothetical protein